MWEFHLVSGGQGTRLAGHTVLVQPAGHRQRGVCLWDCLTQTYLPENKQTINDHSLHPDPLCTGIRNPRRIICQVCVQVQE